MFDIFEKPWPLAGLAVLVLFGVLTFRSIFPQKRLWWQLLLPVILFFSAFGLDFFVKTDLEKVRAVIKAGLKAVEQENPWGIEAIIADNYSDSFHETKAILMLHCRNELSRSPVEKTTKTDLQIEMSPPQAIAVLTVLIKFEKDSSIAASYKQIFLIEVKLHLQKQRDKSWLINRSELLEVDKQPVSWRQVR